MKGQATSPIHMGGFSGGWGAPSEARPWHWWAVGCDIRAAALRVAARVCGCGLASSPLLGLAQPQSGARLAPVPAASTCGELPFFLLIGVPPSPRPFSLCCTPPALWEVAVCPACSTAMATTVTARCAVSSFKASVSSAALVRCYPPLTLLMPLCSMLVDSHGLCWISLSWKDIQ